MGSHSINVHFESEASEKDVQAWLDNIVENLPAGTTGTLEKEWQAVAAEDLTEDDAGRTLRIKNGRWGFVEGTLDATFPLGRGHGTVVIVDGAAYPLTFEVVEVY